MIASGLKVVSKWSSEVADILVTIFLARRLQQLHYKNKLATKMVRRRSMTIALVTRRLLVIVDSLVQSSLKMVTIGHNLKCDWDFKRLVHW